MDTGYDKDTSWVLAGRVELYDRLAGKFDIRQLAGINASGEQMLQILAEADAAGQPFRAVVVSSHGSPGVVYDSTVDGIMLSQSDPPDVLHTIGNGRLVYLACCESAAGSLPRRLLDNGAHTVAGFRDSPSWYSDEGRRLWRELDQQFLVAILHEQGARGLRRMRRHYLEQAEFLVPFAEGGFRRDLSQFAAVLDNMVIRTVRTT